MKVSFDNYGWYSPIKISGREIEVVISDFANIPLVKTVGIPYPNFTGKEWIWVPYFGVPVPGTPPPPVTPPLVPNHTTITKYQFLARFTVAERTAIYLSKNTTLLGWIQVFNNCNDIELLHADTITVVELLDTLNLITTPRKLIILTP